MGSMDSLSRRLLEWYDENRRDLPWRQDREPYSIWLSEVMLQQTQVKTVIPYFRAFLERFPSFESLAAAPLEQVLAQWTGLGYYRRARQLHAAARRLVELGGFPTHSEDLRQLPGVGDYTAAAIASMAFDQVVAVLDGNVERLLARWLAFGDDPKRAKGRRRLRAVATNFLDPARPGDANQALMELGATICRPRDPACGQCPLSSDCHAHRQGNPTDYPPPRQRRAVEQHHLIVAVAQRGEKILLFQRPEDQELMPALWELPNVPSPQTRTSAGLERLELSRLAKHFETRYGGRWTLGTVQASVRHAITFRNFAIDIHRAEICGGDMIADGPAASWVDLAHRQQYAASSLVEKVLRALPRERDDMLLESFGSAADRAVDDLRNE